MQHCKYWNHFVFLLAHLIVFLVSICFLSSSLNTKKKFWGVPHFLDMYVIFLANFSDFLDIRGKAKNCKGFLKKKKKTLKLIESGFLSINIAIYSKFY